MKSYLFEIIFTVRDYELDFQGIVNNSVYLNYLEHTRHEFVKQSGLNLPELHREGIDPVLVHADIQYKTPLVSGNQFASRLNVYKEGVRFVFYQDIYRLPDEKLIIKAKIETAILKNGVPERYSVFDDLINKYHID